VRYDEENETNTHGAPSQCRDLLCLIVSLAEHGYPHFQAKPFEDERYQYHAGDNLWEFNAECGRYGFTMGEVEVGDAGHAEVYPSAKDVPTHAAN
jgi:hypothetical protein